MPLVKVGDLNVECYVDGDDDRPPLLMIMGLGGQARSWGPPFQEALRRHYRTIRYSHRGTGLSDKPGGDLTVRLMADDAAGLLGALGIPRAHVLGISMGGMVAQELALNHPEAVQGLVLGCTNCGPAHSVPTPPESIARFAQIQAISLDERIQQFWEMTVTPGFIETDKSFLDEIIRIHLDSPTPWETFGRQFMAIQSFDTYDRLPNIQAPTLIIHGDQDLLVPAGNAEVLAGRIPNSQVRIIPGVGHCFFWEKPAESGEAIVEFLSSVPAPA